MNNCDSRQIVRNCLIFLFASISLTIGQGQTVPSQRVQKAKQVIPELFGYTDHRGITVELSPGHWLHQWLEEALEGALTEFEIVFFTAPSDAPYYRFGAASSAPNSNTAPGKIWIKSEIVLGAKGQMFNNHSFLNSWFAFFFEISNLMSAAEFEKLNDQAVHGSISEDEYCRAVITTERKANFRGILLFDSIVGPLRQSIPLGEPDIRAAWEDSPLLSPATHNDALLAIDVNNPQDAGHFRYFRKVYRDLREMGRFPGSSIRRAEEIGVREAIKNLIPRSTQ